MSRNLLIDFTLKRRAGGPTLQARIKKPTQRTIFSAMLLVNRMKTIFVVTFPIMVAALCLGQGQVAPERPAKRIVTRTRLVAIFSDLEDQLFKGLQEKNEKAVKSLLGEEFQVWTPTAPGDPVPLEDWQKQSLAEDLKSFHVRQMAARAVDDNAVLVHFVLSKTVDLRGKALVRDYFIVDLWQKNDDKWQLCDRYASPLGAGVYKPAMVRPSGKN